MLNCDKPSLVYDTSISYSLCTLYFRKVTVTPEHIEGPLIMSQSNLTQFFKSTSNKRNPDGPDGDRKTTVTKTKCEIGQALMNILTRLSEQLLTFEFAMVNTEVFPRVGLILEYVALANNHLQIAWG